MIDNPNWLNSEDWKRVQDTVPIACVDVLPVSVGIEGRIARVGLIYRETPHQGRRWCMVGGRLWRNESLVEAATRQLRETLGSAVQFTIAAHRQPDHVVQYFTSNRPVGLLDPRQHAVTLVYIVPITGEISPGGEAILFRWFDVTDLPAKGLWGFRQDEVTAACLLAGDEKGERPTSNLQRPTSK